MTDSGGPRRGRSTFTIPAAGEPGAAAAGPPPAADPGEPPRILVVDDDPRTLRFVRDALSPAGYAPIVAGEPEDIQRIIRTERPALVLLDLVLPGRDGIAPRRPSSDRPSAAARAGRGPRPVITSRTGT